MKKLFAVLFTLTFLLIVFATVSPIGLRPQVVFAVNVDRALAFTGFAAFGVLAWPARWPYIVVASLILPALIEATQFLSPTRHAHMIDIIVKSAGALSGCLLALILVMIVKQLYPRLAKA